MRLSLSSAVLHMGHGRTTSAARTGDRLARRDNLAGIVGRRVNAVGPTSHSDNEIPRLFALLTLASAITALAPRTASARVVRVVVDSRVPIGGGHVFGCMREPYSVSNRAV